jgi:alkylation response protein AidB-like acyl-CoA dehydrogenase
MQASLAYAQEREAFGRPIGDQQAVQLLLADIAVTEPGAGTDVSGISATETEAARLLIHHAARLKDQGLPFAVKASIGRRRPHREQRRSGARRVRFHEGVHRRADLPRLQADQIYEGTNQIQRVIIARDALGARRPRPAADRPTVSS